MLAVLECYFAVIHLQTNGNEAALCDFCMESIVLSCHPLLLPQMLQLSAEMLGTSGPLTALLNSYCLSEAPLSNRVNKFPYIGGKPDQTEVPVLPKIHPLP